MAWCGIDLCNTDKHKQPHVRSGGGGTLRTTATDQANSLAVTSKVANNHLITMANNDAFSTGQSQETAGPSVGIIKVLQNRF